MGVSRLFFWGGARAAPQSLRLCAVHNNRDEAVVQIRELLHVFGCSHFLAHITNSGFEMEIELMKIHLRLVRNWIVDRNSLL